jgi:hypothetical protein
MGYFARIENNTVVEVIAISNHVLGETTLSFPDTEGAGRAFIANTLGLEGEWRQTSFNASFRGKYAGVGDRYDAALDEFVSPVIEPTE